MRTPAAAMLVVLWSATIGLPQDPTPYRALVESYRHNGPDETNRALQMPREAIASALDDALSTKAGWTWDELRAAAMLHSQACISAIRVKDAATCDLHITVAQRLLDRVVSLSPLQRDFAWRWYRVVPELVDALGGRGIRKRLDEYARSKWAHDAARAQFVRGLGLEYKGAREGRILAPGESATFSRGDGQEVYFVPAAAAFSEALKEDPELLAAALHLGRLRMLEGHRDQAAALFRSALADADPSVAYLAALLLGSLEERAERFDDAERLYRDALTRVPYGQSAPLALAELLSRTGREAEARKTLADRLLRVDAPVIEPLWAYVATSDQEIGTRFDLLRMEVWK